MEEESLASRPPFPEILAEAKYLFVTMTAAQRQTRDELRQVHQGRERLALASVEAIELLTDTIAGFSEGLEDGARHALDAAREAAHERLKEVGIELDGTVGEAVDPSRHRVIKGVAPSGRLPNVVKAIWRPGIRLQGARLRAAEIVAEYSEGTHGKDRD